MSPLAVCIHVFGKLADAVNFSTIASYDDDDEMREWLNLARYRFICVCDAIFDWEMRYPEQDFRLLIYRVWRDSPLDDNMAHTKSLLGGVENTPTRPPVGRPGKSHEPTPLYGSARMTDSTLSSKKIRPTTPSTRQRNPRRYSASASSKQQADESASKKRKGQRDSAKGTKKGKR